MTKSIELLTFGGAFVDINCTQFPFDDQGLLPETEVVGDAYEVVPGGSAPNFARFCASLGLKTGFVGKIGQDKMGLLFTDLLKEAGVLPELIIDPKAATNISLNIVNPAGRSIMAVAGNSKHLLTTEEIAAKITALLPDTEYLMIGGAFRLEMLLPVLGNIVAAAKESNTKLIVDHGRLVNGVTPEESEAIKNLIARSDYYFPSRDEFMRLWSVSSIEEGLAKVAELPDVITVVKDSTNGAITMINDKVVRVATFTIEAVNTIGAGDSFNAGFIVAQKGGMSIEDSMRFACATAALKISKTELPTRDAVQAFMESTG